MENGIQLANRFREVLLNGKWIANTNYKDRLIAMNWREATQKVADLNTIADLTFHINYYIEGVNNVFEGGSLDIRDKFSFDAPAINSEEEWNDRVETLISNAEKFGKNVEKLTEETLESNFVNEKYGSYQRNIEGMIEHCYYHLGQISLIAKMVKT